MGIIFLLEKVIPSAVATIISLIIAVGIYGISLIKLGALSADEVKALPKGQKIYQLFLKLRLMKEV